MATFIDADLDGTYDTMALPASIDSREKRVRAWSAPRRDERGDARRIAAQRVERLAERTRVARWNEDAGLAVAHDLGHAAGARGHDGATGQHRLDEHATERLGQHGRVDDDVARGEEARHVVARAEHVDAAGERREAAARERSSASYGASPLNSAPPTTSACTPGMRATASSSTVWPFHGCRRLKQPTRKTSSGIPSSARTAARVSGASASKGAASMPLCTTVTSDALPPAATNASAVARELATTRTAQSSWRWRRRRARSRG